MHPAKYWEALAGNRVRCLLCPQNCVIKEGGSGFCRARSNHGGKLYSENYGWATSVALDPIEKKPLYHFKPGKPILSLGSFGCNFRCLYCQNHSISQQKTAGRYFDPETILALIAQFEDNVGVAFTYNEPLIWFEFIFDAAKLIKEKKPEASVVLVTNGFINQAPLAELLPYIDALNIDLKSFNDDTYRSLCKGRLNPVLETIQTASKKCHVEVTTLVLTDTNDSPEEIGRIAEFLASVDKRIPLHLSRYYPNYLLKKPATSGDVLFKAHAAARKHLDYVYIGNHPEADTNTYCPNCGNLLIERKFYFTKNHLQEPACPRCGEKVPVIL